MIIYENENYNNTNNNKKTLKFIDKKIYKRRKKK